MTTVSHCQISATQARMGCNINGFVVVAVCDVVHDMDILFYFCLLPRASGNLF